MPKKKKEVEMPKIKNSAVELINKKTKFYTVVAVIVFVAILCIGLLARNQPKPEYIQKGVVTNYACQVVDVDNESGFFAVQCFTK